MFKKYLCLSLVVHLFVLWGVGTSLPPSPTGKQEPIVLEFKLGQPQIYGGMDLIGDRQEESKAISEGRASAMAKGESQNKITQTGISHPPTAEPTTETDQESPNTNMGSAVKKEESLYLPEKGRLEPDELGQFPKESAQADSAELAFWSDTPEANSETNLLATDEPPKSGNCDALAKEGTCTAPGTGSPSSAEQAEGGAENLEPVRRPVLVKHKNPFYPLVARKKGWEGTVTFQIKLDPSGRVSAVALLESSGYDILDEEAAKSVGAWRYEPAANQDGDPIDCLIKVKITFALQN